MSKNLTYSIPYYFRYSSTVLVQIKVALLLIYKIKLDSSYLGIKLASK
jgi:hypothetical protein